MSNQNQNNQSKAKDIGPVVLFNRGNRQPVKAEWTLTQEDMKSIVSEYVKEYINDAKEITVQLDSYKDDRSTTRIPIVRVFVWLSPTSPNLCDRSLNTDDSVVKKNMTVYSPKLKELMAKLGINGAKTRPVGDANARQKTNWRGFELDALKILELEFDVTGVMYKQVAAIDQQKKTQIDVTVNTSKRSNEYFDITVAKFIPGRRERSKPLAPTKAYNG